MIDDKRNLKHYIFSQMELKKGARILDLGCGNGDDMKLLQHMYPQFGLQITAIDKETPQEPIPDITFLQHDLNTPVPLPDASFDIIYSHNFFECVSDKQAHLKELHRLLADGGVVVYSHTDWDSQLMDGPDKDLIRKVFHAYAEWQQPWMTDIDSWMGRRLNGIFQTSGLFKGNVTSYTIVNTAFQEGNYCFNMIHSFQELVESGLIKQAEYDTIYSHIQEYQKQNMFFYSITTFIYQGKKHS